MAITVNIFYKGKNGSAISFAKEMIEKGVVQRIREEKGKSIDALFREEFKC